MKRLLKLPVLLGVGVAALALGGVAAAAASSAGSASTQPAGQVSTDTADTTGSTDSTDTADTTGSTDATESATANDGALNNTDDAAVHDVQDETGDHQDETTPASGASATAGTPEADEVGNNEHSD